MSLFVPLEAQQVPVFETFVVPRYLSMYGSLMLEMLLPCEGAVIANLGCRTGYPDTVLNEYLPGCRIIGFDPSDEAIELARNKSVLLRQSVAEYCVIDDPPFPIADESFSHVIALYPLVEPSRDQELVMEAYRLLTHGGQALWVQPLRGSYQEIVDLLREYALKHDAGEVAKAIEAHVGNRPTLETFSEVFEGCGFTEVDVDMRMVTLPFDSGRELLEDPMTRLLLLPDLEMAMNPADLSKPMDYVKDAINSYWSESTFEVSINIGCCSARKA